MHMSLRHSNMLDAICYKILYISGNMVMSVIYIIVHATHSVLYNTKKKCAFMSIHFIAVDYWLVVSVLILMMGAGCRILILGSVTEFLAGAKDDFDGLSIKDARTAIETV